MPELLTYTFMQNALAAGAVSGAMLSVLGLFVVLRRMVFLGAAIPQFAALGVSAGFLVGLDPLAGSLAGALAGVMLLGMDRERGRRSMAPDSRIGLFYAVCSALAILLLVPSPHADTHALTIISGEILGVSRLDVVLVALIMGVVAVVLVVFWNPLKLVSYDPEVAAASGFNVTLWNVLLFLMLGVAIAATMRISGAVVSFAYLVGPPLAMLAFSRRMPVIVLGCALIGAVGTVLGLVASFEWDLPGGPTIAAAVLLPALPPLAMSWVGALRSGFTRNR